MEKINIELSVTSIKMVQKSNKTLVLSVICSKYGSNNYKIFKGEDIEI